MQDQPNLDLDDAAYFAQTLRAMVAHGRTLLDDLVADPDTTPADKAQPFERLATAIRRCIALHHHLAANPTPKPQPQPGPAGPDGRAHARRTILRDVEAAIETRAARAAERREPHERPDDLRHELHERLDTPEFERDLATRPLAEIIAEIKRDLGLVNDVLTQHPRRRPADLADLEARAAAPPRRPAAPAAAEAGAPAEPAKVPVTADDG